MEKDANSLDCIGKRLRKLREEHGLSQSELAKELNVKQQTIDKWERGERDLKTGYTITLAKYFNVSSDYLLGLSDYKMLENTDICEATGLSEDIIALLKSRLEHYEKLIRQKDGNEDFYHEQKEDEFRVINIFIKAIIKNSLNKDIFHYSNYLNEITKDEESNDNLSRAIVAYNIYKKFMKLMKNTFDDCTGYKKEKVDEIIEKETGFLD